MFVNCKSDTSLSTSKSISLNFRTNLFMSMNQLRTCSVEGLFKLNRQKLTPSRFDNCSRYINESMIEYFQGWSVTLSDRCSEWQLINSIRSETRNNGWSPEKRLMCHRLSESARFRSWNLSCTGLCSWVGVNAFWYNFNNGQNWVGVGLFASSFPLVLLVDLPFVISTYNSKALSAGSF